jgi:hypothetical protein
MGNFGDWFVDSVPVPANISVVNVRDRQEGEEVGRRELTATAKPVGVWTIAWGVFLGNAMLGIVAGILYAIMHAGS